MAAESYPEDLRYHPEHDWARIEGDTATLGITWYGQDALGERGRHVAHADALIEHRRVRPGGHLAALENRHPLPGHGALLHHEGDEPALRPALLDPP